MDIMSPFIDSLDGQTNFCQRCERPHDLGHTHTYGIEYDLEYCKVHGQMTNHSEGKCQKGECKMKFESEKDVRKKIILDLCGGTGSWARPWKETGYKVITITLPDYDVTNWTESGVKKNAIYFWSPVGKEDLHIARKDIYGILAAPPCTMFSFARTNAKTLRDLKEGMKCVRSCLDIIWSCKEISQDTGKKTLPIKFWALENPYHGFLPQFLGKPSFTFDPWEFGDGYQKRTALWGHFKEPIKKPIPMTKEMKKKALTNSHIHTLGVKFDYLKSKDIHPEMFGKFDRQTRRSITPKGFADAFYQANK